MTTTKGTDMTDTFTKSAAIKRVRQVIASQQWQTKGRRIEVSDLNGCTDPLTRIGAKHCKHNAEFRVLMSTVGRNGELQDIFRMNIGNADAPAFLVNA